MNLYINAVTYACLVQNILVWFNLLTMVRILGVQSIQQYCRNDSQEKRTKTMQGKILTAPCQIIFRQWG